MRSFIANERPKRIVEIGSGFSSALILDTLDELGDTTTVCTFVEPFPARLEALLRDADRTRHRLFVNVVQDVPLSIFDELEAGDVLVIDSSHVSKAGSDVNHLFFDVLPRLAPGVFVHVHDVIWPFSYPELWLAEGRAWNESYLLKAFLQFNEAFEVEFSMGYVILPHLERVKRELPRVYDAPGTAFWIRRKR
jgi:predicted O-methyltransferase YrrM